MRCYFCEFAIAQEPDLVEHLTRHTNGSLPPITLNQFLKAFHVAPLVPAGDHILVTLTLKAA